MMELTAFIQGVIGATGTAEPGLSGVMSSVGAVADAAKRQRLVGSEAETLQLLSFYSRYLAEPCAKESDFAYAAGVLDGLLLSKAYLSGGLFPGVADLVVFHGISTSPVLAKTKPQALLTDYPNLARWFDCVQHVPEVRAMNPNLVNFPLVDVFAQHAAGQSGGNASQRQDGKSKGKGGGKGGDQKQKQKQKQKQPKQKQKQPKQKGDSKKEKAGVSQSAGGDAGQPEITKLDIRVGKILSIEKHPEKDKIYCEQIDLAEKDGPRSIASGLVEFYPDPKVDKKVLVVCNLKPRKMGNFVSNGMVLCGSNEGKSKVEVVDPPADAQIGERVLCSSLPNADTFEPFPPNKVAKKKVFEAVAPKLVTNAGREACWIDESNQAHPLCTAGGPCKVPTIANGHVG